MPSTNQLDAVCEIADATRRGREIVCLIGAGLSVESGIPPLTKLTQYLAKVESYIHNGAFRPPARGDSTPRFGDEFLSNPSLYLRDIGWPDPNQLNADFWSWIDQHLPTRRSRRDYRNYLSYFIRTELVEDLLRFDPSLKEGLGEAFQNEREARLGLQKELGSSSLFASRQWKMDLKARGLWNLGGNWKTLLSHLTDANPDHADALFQHLIRNRRPGMAHRFLAFLTPILGMKLFLTVNFDDLLEEALRHEGFHPVVYAVSRNSSLPDPALVRNQLSVVKLHGDAFGLRLGEDLDHPLDEESRARLWKYLPDQPLLLVLGVGGNDRRVMDFVELAAQKHENKYSPAAYWFHFESTLPSTVKSLQERARISSGQLERERIRTVQTHSPASLLLELFSRLTGSHPPSFHPYDPKMPRPIVPEREISTSPDSSPERDFEPPVRIFPDDDAKDFEFGASLDLAHFVASKAGTHIPIWIDLEAMHTYEDVAIDIIQQIRRYDRSIPPITLPGGPAPDAQGVEKAVRRICDALQRDRYILAFNGVGRFGRPPTWHDGNFGGDSDSALVQEETERSTLRTEFVLALIAMARPPRPRLRDSILALSLQLEGLDSNLRRELQPLLSRKKRARRSDPKGPSPLGKEYGDALMLLASFRRRRSYVALLHLLPRYLPEKEGTLTQDVETFLRLAEPHYILRIPGGEYWMCRRLRDEVYLQGKRQAEAQGLLASVRTSLKGELDLAPFKQLTLLARIHADIARYCYSDLFASSGQPAALLEHLYHQVASLRYLTRLDAWLVLAVEGELPEEVRTGLGKLIHHEACTASLAPIPLTDQVAGVEERREAVALRTLRLQRLRTLRRVFEREREVLLSLISSDTLISWIDWLQSHDIKRFLVRTSLASGRVNHQEALGLLETRLELESGTNSLVESNIRRLCEEFGRLLTDFKAEALRNKMDFSNCQDVRIRQLFELFGMKPPHGSLDELFSLWADHAIPWLESGSNQLMELPDHKAMRVIVRCLCDIWLCILGRGGQIHKNEEHASWPLSRSRMVIDEAMRRFGLRLDEAGASLNAMMVRWFRNATDHELVTLSPWGLRPNFRSSVMYGDLAERLKRAIQLCDEALRVIEWATEEAYARYRSYFRSLKGRALYLRAFIGDGESKQLLLDALRELDRSQAGLLPHTGANREALAVRLLRLAECLMVHTDDALADVDDDQEAQGPKRATRKNVERWLKRAQDLLDQAEEMLQGARQNVEWWSCLYQLRAQIHVEGLLFRITLPSPTSSLAPHIPLAGLNAIRNGLDVLLPVHHKGKGSSKHFRIDRFLRVWIELMVCSATLANRLLAEGADPADSPTPRSIRRKQKVLWDRWASLNETARLNRLADVKVFDYFSGLIQKLPIEQGPAARRQVLSLISERSRPAELQQLWRILQNSETPMA